MSDIDQQLTEDDPSAGSVRTGEEQFVRYLAKWALLVSLLILLLDIAVVRNYPFPGFLGESLRGFFYSAFSIGLFIVSLFLAFLGYRIITLNYVGRTKALYLIFLPAVLFLTSIFWLVLLATQS